MASTEYDLANDAKRNSTDHEKPSTGASAPHPSVPCLSQPRPLRHHPLADPESSNRRPSSLRLRFRICVRQTQLEQGDDNGIS